MKIIRYGGWEDIDVQFQDDFYYIKEHQTYSNFKKGEVKNPYDRTVFGVGYVGVGKYKTKENGRIKFDVGSHSEFFYLEGITFEEYQKAVQ